jgi:hypothetical protein
MLVQILRESHNIERCTLSEGTLYLGSLRPMFLVI